MSPRATQPRATEKAAARGGPGCAGCLFKGGLGCGAFFAGAAVVVFALAPALTGDWVRRELERNFDETWEGRLELGALELAWTDRQRAGGVALLAPDGERVAAGTLTTPPLLDLVGFTGEPREQRFELRLDEVTVAVDATGRTGLGRALTLTESGRLERDRARRRGESWGGSARDLRRPLRLALRIDRVLRKGAGEPLREVAADLVADALLVPGRGAELQARARLTEGEGGELRAALRLPGPDWTARNAPFELDVAASGLGTGWVRLVAGEAPSLADLLGPALELELRARRGEEGEVELARIASGALDLTAEGAFTAPDLLSPAAWSDAPPVRVAELRGDWRGFPIESLRLEVLGPASLAWAGEGRDVGFELTATANAAGERWPLWVLAVDPPALLLPDGSVLEGLDATLSGSAPGAPLALRVRAENALAECSGTPVAGGFADVAARLAVDPGASPAEPWLREPFPFLAEVRRGSGPSVLVLEDVDVPEGGGATSGRGHLDPGGEADGGAVRLAEPVARLFGPRADESLRVSPPGLVELVLEGDVVRYPGVELEGDTVSLHLSGEWNRRTDEVDLALRVPISLLAEGTVPFLDENRDLIGAGVEVPLILRGPADAPAVEVHAAFRADVLETAVGSMRDLLDFLEEKVSRPLGDETRELFEQFGGLLERRE